MRLFEPYTLYHCTRCRKTHMSQVPRHEEDYREHLGYADSYGVVKRYQLNQKLTEVGFATTALFFLGLFGYVAVRIVSNWPPHRLDWQIPWPISAGFWVSCAWLILIGDGPFTFSAHPLRRERRKEPGELKRSLREGQRGIASWIFLAAGMLFFESQNSAIRLMGSFLLGVTATAVLFYAPKDEWKPSKIWELTKAFFWVWVALTLVYYFRDASQDWAAAALEGLTAVGLVAAAALLLIGAVRLFRIGFVGGLVLLVRLWRHAERIADEEGGRTARREGDREDEQH